jgi:hypothetical protein
LLLQEINPNAAIRLAERQATFDSDWLHRMTFLTFTWRSCTVLLLVTFILSGSSIALWNLARFSSNVQTEDWNSSATDDE